MPKEIDLGNGKAALVDDDQFERLSVMGKWTFSKSGTGYAYRQGNKSSPTLLMHHAVLPLIPNHEMDHINGNTLDNRRSNLRLVTHVLNMQNRKIHKNNKSGRKGVYFDSRYKSWRAQIVHFGKKVCLGSFGTIDEASIAYKNAAKVMFGEFERQEI